METEIFGHYGYFVIQKDEFKKQFEEISRQFDSISEYFEGDGLEISEYYEYLKDIQIPKGFILIVGKKFRNPEWSKVGKICVKVIVYFQNQQHMRRLLEIIDTTGRIRNANGLCLEVLKEKNRGQPYCNIRQIVMYEAWKKGESGTIEAGAYFNRDHATAISARRSVQNFIDTDNRYNLIIKEIEATL
jgi:hypothetical protein